MPKIFLSHSSKDNTLVGQVYQKLRNAFLHPYLDEEQLTFGSNLFNDIYVEIENCDIFIAFISPNYTSDWCIRELESAMEFDKKKKILPVIIMQGEQDDGKWALEMAPIIRITLRRFSAARLFPSKNLDTICQGLIKSAWAEQPIRLAEMQHLTFQAANTALQVITFEMDDYVKAEILKNWNFNLNDFIATASDNVIKKGVPVGFVGKGPNRLYTFLSIPLANNRDIFVYNEHTYEFVCVYTKRISDNYIGKTIPHKITFK